MVQVVAVISECKLHSEEFAAQTTEASAANVKRGFGSKEKKNYILQGKTHHLRLKYSEFCNHHLTFFVHVRITKHLL